MSTPAGETSPCPYCQRPISCAALICPFCHLSVVGEAWPPAPSGQPTLLPPAHSIAGGIVASNIAAALLVALNFWIVRRADPHSATLVSSDFIIVPLVMGFVCAFFWRNLGLSTGQYGLYSLLCSLVALVTSGLLMGEGVICLLIVSPLIVLLVWIGALLGRVLFFRNSRLRVSVLPLALLCLVSDSLARHEYHNSVSDTVLIHACPSAVWAHLANVPPLTEPPRFWLFRLGLPYPTGASATACAVGAARRCVFQGNLVFQERITECQTNQRLTFDVTQQPRHPEIWGHARVLRGQFLLRDNGDGTTTLTGTSWYALSVYPSWYYDLWASQIARAVHLRVMTHIQTLCERESHFEGVRLRRAPPARPALHSGPAALL